MTIGALSTRYLSDINMSRRYEIAASIADRQFTMIDYMGIEDFIEIGQMEGEHENDGVKYIWRAAVEELEIGNLYELRVIISFKYKNRLHSVLVCSRLNGKGSLALIGQGSEAGG